MPGEMISTLLADYICASNFVYLNIFKNILAEMDIFAVMKPRLVYVL